MTEEQNNLPRLPISWVWTKLGEICLDPQYGWTTSAVAEGSMRLVRTTDITSGNIDWDSVPYCKKEPPETEKYLVEDGDILVSRAGSVGYSYLVENPKPAIFASYLIRFKPLVEGRYLGFFLQSPFYWESISEKSIGIAVPNVNASKLKQILVPLAPLPEQRRIVARVEELFSVLDAGVESLRKIKAQLKRYRQAVLKYAFEGKLTEEWRKTHRDQIEPAQKLLEQTQQEKLQKVHRRRKDLPPIDTSDFPELPESWAWIRLGEISDMIQYGTSERAGTDQKGIPVLRMGNIQEEKLIFQDLKFFPEDWPRLADFILEDGDVLFNRTNSAKLVGKTAIYKKHNPKAVFASYLIRVKTNRDVYCPDLLSFFINSFYGRRYIASVVSQQVGQANVNGTKLSLMPIPLMPILEQQKIKEELEHSFSIADKMDYIVEGSLKQAEQLRQSVSKRAFEGKLVPQDPSDEPADRLLARIKEEKAKHEIGTNSSRDITKKIGLMRYVE